MPARKKAEAQEDPAAEAAEAQPAAEEVAPDSAAAETAAPGPRTFSTDALPSDPAEWPAWRKHAVTKALRIEGPFRVETSEGPLDCQDGYLAVDARGYPYPIAADEFGLIYKPAGPEGEPPAQPDARTVAQILADFDPRYRPASQAYVVELYRGVATYVNGSMPDGDGKALALEGLSRSLGDALSLVGGGQPKVAQ